MGTAVGLGEDRYAVFEALSGGQPNQASFPPQQQISGGFQDAAFPPQQQQQQQQQPVPPQQQIQQQQSQMVSSMETSGISNASSGGLFTDLDPLGTGKSKPYVDKKDFFSELKSTSPKLGSMSNNDSRESPVNFGSMETNSG